MQAPCTASVASLGSPCGIRLKVRNAFVATSSPVLPSLRCGGCLDAAPMPLRTLSVSPSLYLSLSEH